MASQVQMTAVALRRLFPRTASPSDLWRLPQISCSSRSTPAQAMAEVTVWRRLTSPTFSSSRGQVSPPGFIDRMPCPSNLQHPLQFSGTSSRSLSESAGWWRRHQATWNGRPEPGRFYHSGSGQSRQFGTAKQRQRHLYLVLDDHDKEFSIHKLDIDNDLDCSSSAETPRRLSEPPFLRIGPPTIGKRPQFAALGSSIIAICPSTYVEEGNCGVTHILDTNASVTVAPLLPAALRYGYEAAITVRDKRLYVFALCTDNDRLSRGSLHCITADFHDDDEKKWSWRPLSSLTRFAWSWIDNPPEIPFDPKSITAHVVHPRGRTIFVSAVNHGTFSYGTTSGRWTRRGDWMLPFRGPAHYDHELGAWVGLHLHSDDKDSMICCLCACRVMSACASRQQPKWKVSREKRFLAHPDYTHLDAKLIYMGEHSRYCLVERLLPKGADSMKYLLRLTTFIVKYGEDGELRTMSHRPACFYEVPNYDSCFDMQAFWM